MCINKRDIHHFSKMNEKLFEEELSEIITDFLNYRITISTQFQCDINHCPNEIQKSVRFLGSKLLKSSTYKHTVEGFDHCRNYDQFSRIIDFVFSDSNKAQLVRWTDIILIFEYAAILTIKSLADPVFGNQYTEIASWVIQYINNTHLLKKFIINHEWYDIIGYANSQIAFSAFQYFWEINKNVV